MSPGCRGRQISLGAEKQVCPKVQQDLSVRKEQHHMKPQDPGKIQVPHTQKGLTLGATNVKT